MQSNTMLKAILQGGQGREIEDIDCNLYGLKACLLLLITGIILCLLF